MTPDAMQDRGSEAMILAFRDNLSSIIARAQVVTVSRLQNSLSVDRAGKVELTAANQQVLRRVNAMLLEAADELGYNTLVNAFIGTFRTQIPLFEEAMNVATSRMRVKPPPITFTESDKRLLFAAQRNDQILITNVVAARAKAAQDQALMAIGGLPFRRLAEAIADQWQKGVQQSESVAATAISSFYRLITAQQTAKIEEALPKGSALKFGGYGPLDKLTRPFCARIMRSRRTYSRAEIEAMDNKQLPNPFVTFGGRNCRHRWIVRGIDEGND
jgi:hypothetical protein